MSAATLPTLRPAAPSVAVAPRANLTGLFLPRLWLQRVRARRILAALHPEQIREAGLDPISVRAEFLKPFWRA